MIQDHLRELLRRTLIADTAVTAYTSRRIHPTEIALVERQQYPCLCFKTLPASVSYIGRHGGVPVRIWVHSQRGYEECYEIFNLVYEKLHHSRYKDGRVIAVGSMTQGAAELFDGEVYSLVSEWSFNCIEI